MNLSVSKNHVPLHQKYGLTFSEGAEYFGIGENKLRNFVKEHPDDDYFLMIGTKTILKRKKFEQVLDELSTI